MDPRDWTPRVDEDVNGYDDIAMLPSVLYNRFNVRTKETLREIQRRLAPHRAALETLRQDAIAYDAFLDAFQWSWHIARSTSSPTIREAAYAALVHALVSDEFDAQTNTSMLATLARFDERHIALLSGLSAGPGVTPDDATGFLRQVGHELVAAGFVESGAVSELGRAFLRVVSPR